MPDTEIEVRPSKPTDVAAMRDIYNHYIAHSHVTFDLEPKTLAERRSWLSQFSTPRHLCLSAIGEDGALLGYACSGEFKAKAAYASSVEVSVYVAPDTIQQGIGQRLYARLLPLLDAAQVHRCYAGIALPNPGSIALHKRHGFQQVAQLSEVGYKFERYWDVIWMQRPPATTPPKR